MNYLMLGGLYCLWKTFAIAKSGVRENKHVLDITNNTNNLTLTFAKKLNNRDEI